MTIFAVFVFVMTSLTVRGAMVRAGIHIIRNGGARNILHSTRALRIIHNIGALDINTGALNIIHNTGAFEIIHNMGAHTLYMVLHGLRTFPRSL
jgi:hypothetical protein